MTPADKQKSDETLRTGNAEEKGVERSQLRPVDISAGTILADKYKVLSLLGHGGMGSVYRVEQIFMQREYALKTLKTDEMSDIVWRRFQKEAQAASRLDHPNLVKAYDFGLLGDSKPYFVMELLKGETLSQRIKSKGTMGVEEALKIFIPVCFGVEYAHGQGIIHRDLKPSNIVLSKKDNGEIEPKVVDFGIAKLTEELEATANALTKTGEIFGTPFYMSPEQCKGTKVDTRSDIYSIGCVLFETLTGTPPFHADSALTVITQHLTDDPPTLKAASLGVDFPPELERVVAKMLAKDPDERYQRMAQVARDLIPIAGGEKFSSAVIAEDEEHVSAVPTKAHKTQWNVMAGASLFVVGIATGLGIGYFQFHEVKKAPSLVADAIAMSSPQTFAVLADPNAPYRKKNGATPNVFHFPDGIPVGHLYSGGHPVPMKGDVEVIPGRRLAALINLPYVSSHPEILMRFNPDDLNGLRLDGGSGDLAPDAEFNDNVMVYVRRLTSLDDIVLEHARLSGRALQYLNDMPKLVKLDIRGSTIPPEAIAEFKPLPRLTNLNISLIKNPHPILVRLLKENKVLKDLFVADSGLTDDELDTIGRMKQITWLDISYNKTINDENFAKLADMKSLVLLDLPNTKITGKSLPILLSLPHLNHVTVSDGQFTSKELETLGAHCRVSVDKGRGYRKDGGMEYFEKDLKQ